jgi:SulP family sulfate permease
LHFPTLLVLATIGLLLNTTALELERSDDVDLNRDLKAEGSGNLIVGLLGGLVGFNAVGPSLIATRFGAHSRWVGVIAAGTIFAMLLLGTHLLDIFPTFILGGILIWAGGSLLLDWLTVRQIAYSDLAIIFLIFGTIAVFGFGFGILAGLIAAAALFIYRYSKVDVVRQQLTGSDFRSDLAGSSRRQEVLHQLGQAIYIVQLHGFLFFGTANRLRRQMQERVRQLGARGCGYLVIDFRQVTGIDTSVSTSFMRLRQATASSGVTIVLTGLDAAARRALLSSAPKGTEVAAIHVEPDLESGVSWCEDALLAGTAAAAATEKRPLTATLAEVVEDIEAAEKIAGYCERMTVPVGTRLVEQGTPAVDIFFIEAGHGSVQVAGGGGVPVHVATVDAGDIVGEIAFYLGDRRSASVVGRDEMVVWRLSRDAVEQLQREAPDVALRFHQGMAALLSRRLARTSRHVSILAS